MNFNFVKDFFKTTNQVLNNLINPPEPDRFICLGVYY